WVEGAPVGSKAAFVGHGFPNDSMVVYDSRTGRVKVLTIPVIAQWEQVLGTDHNAVLFGRNAANQQVRYNYDFSSGHWRELKPPVDLDFGVVIGQTIVFPPQAESLTGYVYDPARNSFTTTQSENTTPGFSLPAPPIAGGTRAVYSSLDAFHVFDTVDGR